MLTNITLFLVAILSVASAFHNKATLASMASVSVLDAHTARLSSRSCSTGMYGSRVRSLSSPSSLSKTREQHSSMRTRLQFSDNASPNTSIESSWWRKLLPSSLPSPNRASTITSSSSDRSSLNESEEQDNVDAYLEFLDRRYRRLHSDDRKEEKGQLKEHDSLVSKGKSFSAMDWLTNGGNNNGSVEITTREQQEDALYVLGVAGLASQKLLQKHHLPTTTNSSFQPGLINSGMSSKSALTMEKVVELKEQIDDVIDVNDTKSLKTTINHAVLNNFLLPIVRVIYVAQRRKEQFLKLVQRELTLCLTKATDGLVNTLSQGPKAILNTVLTVCGGKQNILTTMSICYATIVVFRPLLRAVFAEGLAFDPLIQ